MMNNFTDKYDSMYTMYIKSSHCVGVCSCKMLLLVHGQYHRPPCSSVDARQLI
jgi:hypothetical protein